MRTPFLSFLRSPPVRPSSYFAEYPIHRRFQINIRQHVIITVINIVVRVYVCINRN